MSKLLPPGHGDYGATIDFAENVVALTLPRIYSTEAAELAKNPRYVVRFVDSFTR